MDIISAIASFSALLIAFLIYSKRNKTISDKILVAWIINFAFHFAVPFFLERKLLFNESTWGMLLGVFVVTHSPFIFVYTLSLTDSKFKLNLKYLFHFGFILIYILAFVPYLILSEEKRMQLALNKQDITYHMFLPMFVLLFCRVYFLIRTIIALYTHQLQIKHVYSFSEKVNLAWLKKIAYGFFFIIALSFLAYGLVSARVISIYWMDYSLVIANIIIFFSLAYFGNKQQLVYTSQPIIEAANRKLKKTSKSKTGIETSEESEKEKTLAPIIQALNQKMTEEKLYLNPELNIGDLANMLAIHAYQLSKLINTQLNKNFYEFVNDFRVQEFKTLVANPKNKHISILGLALDAGFNSKASFNRIFKNSTGTTPSEFRESFQF